MSEPVRSFGEPLSIELFRDRDGCFIRGNGEPDEVLIDIDFWTDDKLINRMVDCTNYLPGVNIKDPDTVTKILFACLRCHAEGDIGGLASGIDNLTDITKKPDGFMTREELISVLDRLEMKLQILEQEKVNLMRTLRAIAEDNLRLRAKAENITSRLAPMTIEEKKPDDPLLARITEALSKPAKAEQ